MGRKLSEETKQKLSKIRKGKPHPWARGKPLKISQEARKRQGKSLSAFYQTAEGEAIKEKHRQRLSGKPSGTLGKHWKLSDETRAKMSKAQKGKPHLSMRGKPSSTLGKHWHLSLETRLKQSMSAKEKPRGGSKKGVRKSPITIQKISETKKKHCQNPEYLRRMMAHFANIKTKPEIKLESILDTYFPREWVYNGDGRIPIGGKSPDFVNIAGKKQVIEVFGRYWHKDEDVEIRTNIFRRMGYSTLIFWEEEVNDTAKVIARIKDYSNEKCEYTEKIVIAHTEKLSQGVLFIC